MGDRHPVHAQIHILSVCAPATAYYANNIDGLKINEGRDLDRRSLIEYLSARRFHARCSRSDFPSESAPLTRAPRAERETNVQDM